MDMNQYLIVAIVVLFAGIAVLQLVDVNTQVANEQVSIPQDHPVDVSNVAQSKVVVMDHEATTKVVVS